MSVSDDRDGVYARSVSELRLGHGHRSEEKYEIATVGRHPQQVNQAVAFHAIKAQALDMLLSNMDPETLCRRLTELFLMNPTSQRQDRNPPRKKSSARALLDFHQRQKKHCF